MVGDWGRHCRGGEINYACALGVAAEHHAGVGAVGRHRLDVAACIIGTGARAVLEIAARRIVDRVHPDRTSAQLRSKRVDKRLPDAANTRRLGCAAGEYDLDVWALLGGRSRETDKCPCRRHQSPEESYRPACARCAHGFHVARGPTDVTQTSEVAALVAVSGREVGW